MRKFEPATPSFDQLAGPKAGIVLRDEEAAMAAQAMNLARSEYRLSAEDLARAQRVQTEEQPKEKDVGFGIPGGNTL